MKHSKNIILIALLIIFTYSFVGCDILDSAQVKLKIKNQDFDYIIQENVDKIIIQNSRDPGFRFIVTDNSAIRDIYDILKKGKIREEKTSLDPDYVLEVYIGDEVKKYQYVVNVDENGVGNFYNDDNIYDISNDLDQTIRQNLSFISKPKNFEEIYYDSIIEVLKKDKDQLDDSEHKVGIDISGDVNCLKYMFSVDLLDFKNKMQKEISNIQLTNNNLSDFDTIITVKNAGYSTKIFKTTITVDNQKDKVYETYYVSGSYEYKGWKITVSEANEKPDNW
ncbi:hypothetical protein ACTNDG_00450 [Clostridium sp. HCP1S3_B4]|uniref:hypothetical protein n=1 Tax=unclassified Clostridium TaxID=2614128 RepID=UPI0016A690F6|nr:hypothetical protein [Clostridiales bacterium]MDY2729868.1 hypothetical protein [Clostridium sp.]NLK24687.1 hypothetical protein [Clostridiales bacterium]